MFDNFFHISMRIANNAAISGRVICNCLDVSENEIMENIELGADLLTLQAKLKCGTECGSCVPELKRLVQMHGRHAA